MVGRCHWSVATYFCIYYGRVPPHFSIVKIEGRWRKPPNNNLITRMCQHTLMREMLERMWALIHSNLRDLGWECEYSSIQMNEGTENHNTYVGTTLLSSMISLCIYSCTQCIAKSRDFAHFQRFQIPAEKETNQKYSNFFYEIAT